jgi:hypothetical protein
VIAGESKSASAFRRLGIIYVHSQCRTTEGIWIASDPFLRLEVSASPVALGEAVFAALGASQSGVSHPPRECNLFQPMLKLSGTKNWSSFVRNTICVGIASEDAARIEFTPYRNLGPKEGFEPASTEALSLPISSSAVEIGAALLQALDWAEGLNSRS